MARINFTEQKHSVLFYDIRVFIFGVEVTPWLTDSVSIDTTDRYGPSTATFSLSNVMDAFVLTDENLGDVDDIQSINRNILELQTSLETASDKDKKGIEARIKGLQDLVNNQSSTGKWRMSDQVVTQSFASGSYGELMYSEKAKKDIYDAKKALNYDSKGNYLLDPLTGQPRYSLNPRSLIIHKHDPVRIFILNPLKEPKRGTDGSFDEQWMPAFTGFVDTMPRSVNAYNSLSTINITCSCIKGMMQKMRFQTNVLTEKFDQGTLGLEDFKSNVGFFEDVRVSSAIGMSHPLSKMSMEESVTILITGQGAAINTNILATERGYLDTSTPNVTKGAVGRFTLGNVYFFPGLDNQVSPKYGFSSGSTGRDMLQDWYDLCLFGTHRDFLTKDEVTFIGNNSGPYSSHSPWNQQLFMLLPGEGTGLTEVTKYSVGTVADQREWETRFNLVLEIVSNLDYQWWTTAMGDMVVEFPMMDFYPEDFGQYRNILTFDYDLLEYNIGDECGEIISYLQCTGNYSFEPLDAAIQAAPVIPRITIQSDILALRFGVIGGEPKNFPFLIREGEAYNPGGAIDFRLARLGLIEFQKRMSEFNILSFSTAFRPFILPNKPVYIVPERRLATTTCVNNTFNYSPPDNSASVGITVRYVRILMPDGKFTLITGADSMPLSYRQIYGSKETYKLNSGIYVRFDDSSSQKDIKR